MRPSQYNGRWLGITALLYLLLLVRGAVSHRTIGIDIPVTPVKGQIWSTAEAPAGTLRKVIFAYEKVSQNQAAGYQFTFTFMHCRTRTLHTVDCTRISLFLRVHMPPT